MACETAVYVVVLQPRLARFFVGALRKALGPEPTGALLLFLFGATIGTTRLFVASRMGASGAYYRASCSWNNASTRKLGTAWVGGGYTRHTVVKAPQHQIRMQHHEW